MRLSCVVALSLSLIGAHGLDLVQPRDSRSPKVVQHSFRRRHVANPLEHDRRRMHRRRSGTVSADLENEETLYLMQVSVGTPAQQVELHIDTGSSDLWVNTPSSPLCEGKLDSDGEPDSLSARSGHLRRESPCTPTGTYVANNSNTYEYVNSSFNITYVDGSDAIGDYATDVVKFSGASLDGQQFGIGYTSTTPQGIIGIGYINNEASVEYGETYSNVPATLVSKGYINANAYSLYLNDLDADEGSIIFGGVDTDKYTGTLASVPIIPEAAGIYAQFIIALTEIGFNGNKTAFASNLAYPALLDSGSSLMYLPEVVADSIFEQVGATYEENEGAAFLSCDVANSGDTVDLTFSGQTISVALSELILIVGSNGQQDVCIIGISKTDGLAVLGDTFLRSAYVVYDLENNEIALAQTDFNSSSSNIVEISKSSGIPNAQAVASPVTDVSVPTGTAAYNQATSSSKGFGMPTAAPAVNMALLGAAAAAFAAAI